MTKEQFFSHNQVKSEFNLALALLAKTVRRGRWIPDGMLVVNDEADLAARPDGAFVSHESLQSGRVRLVEGVKEGYVELEGSPDMALEVISDSSVHKDTVVLRDLYWRAKVAEYWLVDARGDRLDFQILRCAEAGYEPTAAQDGWLWSSLFGRFFQLRRSLNELGHPEYALLERE
jgi:Uma2 family endonuclease